MGVEYIIPTEIHVRSVTHAHTHTHTLTKQIAIYIPNKYIYTCRCLVIDRNFTSLRDLRTYFGHCLIL